MGQGTCAVVECGEHSQGSLALDARLSGDFVRADYAYRQDSIVSGIMVERTPIASVILCWGWTKAVFTGENGHVMMQRIQAGLESDDVVHESSLCVFGSFWAMRRFAGVPFPVAVGHFVAESSCRRNTAMMSS